jgi:hypothetical protein
VILQHIPREHNEEANRLAQSAPGYRENQEFKIGEKKLLTIWKIHPGRSLGN